MSLKMKIDSAKNGKWIVSFKKFGRLRVKIYTTEYEFGYVYS